MADWLNDKSRRVATDMARVAIRSDNLNAGAEGAAVVAVLLCRMIARDTGTDPEDMLAALIGHANDLVTERAAAGRPVLTVLQGGKITVVPGAPKGEDDGT